MTGTCRRGGGRPPNTTKHTTWGGARRQRAAREGSGEVAPSRRAALPASSDWSTARSRQGEHPPLPPVRAHLRTANGGENGRVGHVQRAWCCQQVKPRSIPRDGVLWGSASSCAKVCLRGSSMLASKSRYVASKCVHPACAHLREGPAPEHVGHDDAAHRARQPYSTRFIELRGGGSWHVSGCSLPHTHAPWYTQRGSRAATRAVRQGGNQPHSANIVLLVGWPLTKP